MSNQHLILSHCCNFDFPPLFHFPHVSYSFYPVFSSFSNSCPKYTCLNSLLFWILILSVKMTNQKQFNVEHFILKENSILF